MVSTATHSMELQLQPNTKHPLQSDTTGFSRVEFQLQRISLESRFILAGTAGSLSRALTSVFANFRPFGFRHTPALPSQLCHPLARTEDASDESWHAHLHIQLVPVQCRAPRHHSNRGNLLRLCAVQALNQRAGHDEDDGLRSLTIKRSFALS